MEVIRSVIEDSSLSPVEKVLFSILYCRKQGDVCRLSVNELVQKVGVGLETLRKSLQNLEKEDLIKIKDECQISDASSFLSCAVLRKELKPSKPDVPRP